MSHMVWPLVGLFLALPLAAQQPRHDHDRVYLHSTATQNNLWVFDSCCDPQIPADPKLNTISNILSFSAGHNPSQIYVDREGFLWVVDSTNNVISKFLAPPNSASNLLVFRVPLGQYMSPGDFHFDANGDPWVLCNGGSKLIKIDHNNMAPVITEISYIQSGHGNPTYFCLHTSGLIYLQRTGGVITQVRKVGTQLVESLFWISPRALGRGLSEGPDLNLWITDSYLCVVDQSGNLIACAYDTAHGPNSTGHPIVFPCGSGCIEAWCSQTPQSYGPSQYRFKSGSLTWVTTWYYAAETKNYTFDGRGRAWFAFASGGVYWSDLPRLNGSSLKYSIPPAPVWGDPTGFARAVTIDKAYDDDGDGFTNLVEVAAGSNPFDPTSTPNSNSPCYLHVPSPTPINSSVTFSLFGKPGNGYYVFAGIKQSASIKFPPFLGELWLGPPIVEVFSSVGKPPFLSVIPPSGVVQWTTGIPNSMSLIGTYYFQGLTFPDPQALGLSNLATLEIR